MHKSFLFKFVDDLSYLRHLIMKKTFTIFVLAIFSIAENSFAGFPEMNYKRINRKAAEEYVTPVRPGYEGRNAYWNTFATKFIYAPSFDFEPVDGAVSYRFTVSMSDQTDNRAWSFVADTPKAALSPVWSSIPAGDVELKVEALNRKGEVVGVAGTRKFLRDFPFQGPYREAVRPYREAAIIGLLYIHDMPAIRSWENSEEPDMSYVLNCYPSKIIGATIRNEVLLARMLPRYRKQAETIARNAARFLMEQSRAKGEPMAYFPPTYYGNRSAARLAENKNKAMTMDATFTANALLDLYDLTGDTSYYNHAIGIAETYRRIQAEDGSLPIKVDLLTGQKVNEVKAMLHPLVVFWERLYSQYGLTDYMESQKRAEEWMQSVAVETFNMTGQFEDISVQGLRPYENLTNCTAAPYAEYLLGKRDVTRREIDDALDLIRFSEDQFVKWGCMPDCDGVHRLAVPCVYEQYKFRVPIDGSACNVARACVAAWLKTGNTVFLAKAKALVDNVTVMQNGDTGRMPTNWGVNIGADHVVWINCSFGCIRTLLQMDAVFGPGQ